MSTVASYPHIVKEPGAAARLESHPRTRVAMIVMDYLARDLSPEEMVRHYPYLTLAEVHAAMTYYHDHRVEIDAEIQTELAELELHGNWRCALGVVAEIERPRHPLMVAPHGPRQRPLTPALLDQWNKIHARRVLYPRLR